MVGGGYNGKWNRVSTMLIIPYQGGLAPVGAGIIVLALEAELLREFGETGPSIVLNKSAATTAALIGGTIGALVGGSPESDQLVEAVAHAGEGTSKAFHDTYGEAGIVAFGLIPANHGDGQFLNTKKDIADGAAKLASCSVFGSRRCLDVCVNCAEHPEKKCRKE